jgi:2-polyprenyl-3-methyl-5-hydroxy-6-metoxy-1,4-benzoquinol methylase
MDELTGKKHWDDTYEIRKRQLALQLSGVSGYCNRLVLEKLLETGMEGKRILEIGAGDSAWLPYLAKKFPTSQFAGLDYSERGCLLLTERARAEGVTVQVANEDMLAESSSLHRSFDIVLSFGVVEHFSDLGRALSAKSRYAMRGGILFTLIPNMAGVLGTLTQAWNREIYLLHNPLNLTSFANGHSQAGLDVLASGYLGSSNFGVLSSCFPGRQGFTWQLYRLLVGASMAVWSVESQLGNLPSSRWLSPYIYAIARVV